MTCIRTAATLAAGIALGVAATLAAQTAPAASRREPQFENATAKSWKSIILPRQPLSFHRHDHARAIIALKSGTLDLVRRNGESHPQTWEAGKAYWYEADPPGTEHADVNNGTEPMEVIVVEFEK